MGILKCSHMPSPTANSNCGGIGFCHLGHDQSVQKCFQLIKHLQTLTCTAQTYAIVLQHYQLMSGLSCPILQNYHLIPWSNLCWLDGVCHCLHHGHNQILVHDPWCPLPQWQYNKFIVNDVLVLNTSKHRPFRSKAYNSTSRLLCYWRFQTIVAFTSFQPYWIQSQPLNIINIIARTVALLCGPINHHMVPLPGRLGEIPWPRLAYNPTPSSFTNPLAPGFPPSPATSSEDGRFVPTHMPSPLSWKQVLGLHLHQMLQHTYRIFPPLKCHLLITKHSPHQKHTPQC